MKTFRCVTKKRTKEKKLKRISHISVAIDRFERGHTLCSMLEHWLWNICAHVSFTEWSNSKIFINIIVRYDWLQHRWHRWQRCGTMASSFASPFSKHTYTYILMSWFSMLLVVVGAVSEYERNSSVSMSAFAIRFYCSMTVFGQNNVPCLLHNMIEPLGCAHGTPSIDTQRNKYSVFLSLHCFFLSQFCYICGCCCA